MSEEIHRKKAESTIDVIPQNARIIFKLAPVSTMTPGGLHKTQKQLDEDRRKAPRFVEVVAISADVYDIAIGDYVGLAPESPFQKVKIGDQDYGIIEVYNVTMTVLGELKAKAIEDYNEVVKNYKPTPNPSSIIMNANKN